MIRYLRLTLAASLRRARSLYLLTVLGVALGVGAVLTVQILNANALAAFRGSVLAVSGDADLSVMSRTPAMPDSLFPAALATAGVQAAWPLYRVDATLADSQSLFLEIVGVDLFAPVSVPFVEDEGARQGRQERQGRQDIDIAEPLAVRGWAAFNPDLAADVGWAPGDTVRVTIGSRVVPLIVGALVDFRRVTPLASRRLVVMDIAQAQGLLGRPGEITQIDVRLAQGAARDEVAARLDARLGPAVEALTPEQRTERAEGLLEAFRLNLTALSLISLFVGLFLVYSSTQASLVRRRAEFGLLRSLGATRAQVFGVIAAEVALLGVLGVAVGVPVGYWAAQGAVGAVSATLTNLYLLQEIETLRLSPALFLLAGGVGVGGAVLGAALPAIDMSRRDTKTLLAPFTVHERLGSVARPLFVTALLLLAGTAGWYGLAGHRWKPAGFALAVALLIALPLLAPQLVRFLAAVPAVRGFGPGYALRGLGVRLQTTASAVAGLGIAVSMLVGITLMVASFRQTLTVWVDSSLRADVYITPPSWRGVGTAATLDPDVAAAVARLPGVVAVDRIRGFTTYTGPRRIAVAGVETGLPGGEARFPLVHGDAAAVFDRVRRGDAVLISEPLARKTGLGRGDSIPLATPDGERRFAVAGVYYDYSSEGGGVVMDLGALRRAFGPGGVNGVSLYLAPDVDAETVVDLVKARFADRALVVRSNRSLRAQVFAVFEQTFAITRILQAMALLIAVAGVTLTLLVLARERLGELALYRALGAARRQVFGLFVSEGVGMGALGLALGAGGGAALAAILIFVINRTYFGWTIQVSVPGDALLWQAASILGAAAAASIYPALRASRTTAAELSRDDV